MKKVVHFAPESVVHIRPESVVHFRPESVVHFHRNTQRFAAFLCRSVYGAKIIEINLDYCFQRIRFWQAICHASNCAWCKHGLNYIVMN